MAKMQGLWRPRPKIDEAEFEAGKARTAARLADLFGVDVPASPADVPLPEAQDEAPAPGFPAAADDELAWEAVVLPLWPGRSRPAIVVGEQADLVPVMAGPTRTEPDLVGVMGQPDEVVRPAMVSDAVTSVSAAVPGALVPRARPSRRRTAPPADPAKPQHADESAKESRPSVARPGRTAARPLKASRKAPASAAASCPYCAVLLEPPPPSSQRCARCRRRIVVKRIERRAVYLTEAAVLVFEAERRRLASAGRLTRDRDRWLKLAAAAGASPQRAARLAAAQVSEETVDGARALFLATVERSFQAARREHRWDDASRIRREHALALYRVARSPVPPPDEIVSLHRDGVAARLRGLAEIAREAELIGATCCDTCRTDAGRVFKIATELRVPRLPHEGCPKGLCRCRWDVPAAYRTTVLRYLRRRPRTDQGSGEGDLPLMV